jgi:uncharacterized protein YukE
MLRRHSAAVLTAAVAAAAAAGCGGSGGGTTTVSATVTWADGLCSAVTTYKDSLTQTKDSLQSGVSKSSLNDAAKSVKDATNTFASALGDLGTPDTEAGKTAKQAVDDLSKTLQKTANTVQSATSESSLLGAVSVVSAALLSAQTAAKNAINQLKSTDAQAELQDAFKQAPACDGL